jgi:hypothetical protein
VSRPEAPAAADEKRRVWVFNLHAELELARGSGGPYEPPSSVKRALQPMLPHARRLMTPGDRDLDDGTDPRALGAGRLGAAWCPTPSALRRLARAGAELPATPSFDVLRRVNSRRFYLELGGGAPGARYVSDDAELAATLAEPIGAWLFKRAFGFAGRGQRRIIGAATSDDRRWLADSLRRGGFLAEPWLELSRELAIHGLLDRAGRLSIGRVCVQETNAQRAWLATRVATPGEVSPAVAAALHRAGYFGPFGIDAYFHASSSGRIDLNPFGELNARYTMGFPIGDPQP